MATARVLFKKFMPVEAYPVTAPVIVATGLFTYMVTRILSRDPDTHKGKYVFDTPLEASKGMQYRNNVRQFFAKRIENNQTSIFQNS